MTSAPYFLLQKAFSRFSNFQPAEWQTIQDIFYKKFLSKGELFAKEGEKARKFGFVITGCLRMYNSTEKGKDLTKHFLRPGDFFVGAPNYCENNTVSIQALQNCEILITDFNILDELAKAKRFLADFKSNLLSHYIKIKLTRENNYLNLEATERYFLFLKSFPNLLNEIPHHYIASYLGISATQLSRIRRKISNSQ